LAYINVSKKIAFTQNDARRLAGEVTSIDPSTSIQESDLSYRVLIQDISLFEDGTLKNFEPIEGVQVCYGRTKKFVPS